MDMEHIHMPHKTMRHEAARPCISQPHHLLLLPTVPVVWPSTWGTLRMYPQTAECLYATIVHERTQCEAYLVSQLLVQTSEKIVQPWLHCL